MTREEYEALLKQKEEIATKIAHFGFHAQDILDVLGVYHDGECRVNGIEGDRVEIRYLKPGCRASCCGKDYGYKKFSAEWLFSDNGAARARAHLEKGSQTAAAIEAGRLKAEEARVLEEAAQEKLAQEQRDIEEFARLKVKFQTAGPVEGPGSPNE